MRRKIVVRFWKAAFIGLIFLLPSCRFGGSESIELLQEAERYYASGTSSNHASHYEESTYYLKQAEDALLRIARSELRPEDQARRKRLLGLTWFHLGNTSESEMLSDIAQEY
jgi:hypothetical protein